MIRRNQRENTAGAIVTPVPAKSPSRRLRLAIVGLSSPSSEASHYLWSVVRNLASEPTVELGALSRSRTKPGIEYIRWLAGLWSQVEQSEMILVGLESQLAIVTRLIPALLAARLHGRRLAVLIDFPSVDRRFPKGMRFFRAIVREADHLVVQTEWEVAALRRAGLTATVIPPVSNVPLAQPMTNVQPHLHVKIDRRQLLEMERIYRAFTIVRQKYPRVELTVSACQDSRKLVEAFLKASGIGADHGVHFWTGMTEEEPPGTDIAICLDAGRSFPLSLVSAWRSGTPALVPSYSLAFLMVKNRQDGIVYSEYGADSLSNAILELVEDPSLVQRLSAQGLQESAAFDWPAIRSHWWKILTPLSM